MGLYFLTFTLRYDPSSPTDLSVEGLQRRKQIVRAAFGGVWKKYLKRRGRSMALAVEVSPRGAVHVHALYHGRRPDQAVTVDVGFRDPLVPAAVWLDYPALPPGSPFRVRAVRPETMAAWKLHGLA